MYNVITFEIVYLKSETKISAYILDFAKDNGRGGKEEETKLDLKFFGKCCKD